MRIFTSQKGQVEIATSLAAALGFGLAVLLLSLNSARAKSRDAKRLADIRQTASALELYFNDKSLYPVKLKDMEPMYIGLVPTAPEPADGNCTPEENAYTYQRITSEDYLLTFCLGQSTGGYSPGRHKLTKKGIE